MTRKEILENAKPILFNTDMVRAILDGRKTVTRRVINRDIVNKCDMEKDGTILCFEDEYGDHIRPEKLCRYRPETFMYVRESVFQGVGHYLDVSGETVNVLTHDFEYYADGLHEKDHWKDKHERTWMHRRPSIHMPKEVARIFLKVTDVKVERLQDITIEQIHREGVKVEYPHVLNGEEKIYAFSQLWNSTIKKADIDLYGWDANPYVWVIEFERIEVEV